MFAINSPRRNRGGSAPRKEIPRAELHLRTIIEAEPECVKVVGHDGCLLEMNPAGLAMLEASSLEEAPQRPLVDYVAPEHRAAFEDLHARVMRGESAMLVFEVIGLKGTHRWLETHAVPLREDTGQVRELLSVTRDITERRKMEDALRESEERFRQLAENIHEVFWLTDPGKNQMLYVSPGYEQSWGRSCESLYRSPRSWIEAIHPEDRKRVLEAAQTRQARGEYDEEYRIVRPDGSVRWIRDRAFPVFQQGKVYRIAGIAEDITERKATERALRESEERFRRIAEQSPDAILIHQDGRIVFANDAMLHLMRASRAEQIVGQPATSVLNPAYAEVAGERIRRLYSGQTLPLSEQQYLRCDGAVVDVEVAAAPFTLQGRPAALVTVRDITTRKEQEKRIARLSRIYAVLSGINSAIVRIRDRQALFEEACRIIVEQGGFRLGWIGVVDEHSRVVRPVAQAGSSTGYFDVARLSLDGDLFEGQGPVGRTVRSGQPVVVNDIATDPGIIAHSEQLALGLRSGAFLPLVVSRRPAGVLVLYAPEPGFFDAEEMKLLEELAGDVSFAMEHIEKEERLNYLAYYDSLTGLPNRVLLQDRLGQHLYAAQRDNAMTALILLDLERFHVLNETLGRNVADEVLKELARRLQAAVRAEDTVARVGGDRFALILTRVADSAEIAHCLHDRIMPVLRDPVGPPGRALRVSAQFAVAIFPQDGGTPEALYANVEAALLKAKERGERYLFYAPEMNARARQAFELENRLRDALESDYFVLHYQPKVVTGNRAISGFEALIRWNDPELGLVPPAEFIPLMEDTGLILEAGNWALAQVERDCLLWKSLGIESPRIAVNVSSLQLRQKDFVDTIVDAVRRIRQAGGTLAIEITESVIMENIEAITPKLQTLRELGVEISIDDFGTGYSSLAYVARLPITALKVDRSFVEGMTTSADSLAIVRSVISLSHSLKLQVVAEGVETREQARMLEELGCDQMQGYLFGRPIPAEQVGDFLNRWPHVSKPQTRARGEQD